MKGFFALSFALAMPLTAQNLLRPATPGVSGTGSYGSAATTTAGATYPALASGIASGSVSLPGFGSAWQGKSLGVFGDSLTSDYSGRWQNGVASLHGMSVGFTDARHGRPMCRIFENYGAPPAATGATTINILNTATDLPDSTISATNQSGRSDPARTSQGGFTATVLMDLRGAPTFTANFPIGQYSPLNAGIAYYNSSGMYVGGRTGPNDIPAGTAIRVPSGAAGLRIYYNTVTTGSANGLMLVTGSVLPGSYQPYDATTRYGGGASGGAAIDGNGHTLAQNIADVDLLLIWLGINDGDTVLGAPGDARTSATFYGCTRNAIETILAAKPGIRLVMISPYQPNPANIPLSPAQNASILVALQSIAGEYGVPVVDLLHNVNINKFDWGLKLQADGVHPQNDTFDRDLIPYIAKSIQSIN